MMKILKDLFLKIFLNIQKGDKICIMGESGGESTLIDLTIGLSTQRKGKN